jgi:hypothetical protein
MLFKIGPLPIHSPQKTPALSDRNPSRFNKLVGDVFILSQTTAFAVDDFQCLVNHFATQIEHGPEANGPIATAQNQ